MGYEEDQTVSHPEASGVVSQVTDLTSEAFAQARDAAQQAASKAQASVAPMVDSRKTQLAESLGAFAQAVQESGQKMRDQQQDTAARFADKTAEQIERASGYLEGKDVRQLISDIEAFGRREPLLFAGAAFAVGVAGARLFKSASRGTPDAFHGNGGPRPGGTGSTASYGTGSGEMRNPMTSSGGNDTGSPSQQSSPSADRSDNGVYATPGGAGGSQ